MSQIMVEAFARSLIDKIMLEAFDVVETDDEKLQMLSDQRESAGIQSQPTRTDLQMQDRSCLDQPETTELIEKMVHGLRNLQIGDTTSVPCHLSVLEKEVKHFVCSMDNVSQPDAAKLADTRTTQGQGDVHQIIHDAVIETTVPTCNRSEKERDSSNEATKVSLSLLHQMIEELQTKVEESQQNQENESTVVGKEKISAWEETVERFIRTIESTESPEQKDIDPRFENILRNTACYSTDKEVACLPAVHSTPFARSNSLKEVAIEEIASSPLSDQDDEDPLSVSTNNMKAKSCNGAQSEDRKKRSVFGRTRKLFRNIFGRRKK